MEPLLQGMELHHQVMEPLHHLMECKFLMANKVIIHLLQDITLHPQQLHQHLLLLLTLILKMIIKIITPPKLLLHQLLSFKVQTEVVAQLVIKIHKVYHEKLQELQHGYGLYAC
jgi:hypothetical protein